MSQDESSLFPSRKRPEPLLKALEEHKNNLGSQMQIPGPGITLGVVWQELIISGEAPGEAFTRAPGPSRSPQSRGYEACLINKDQTSINLSIRSY